MTTYLIVLRIVHILSGSFWAGSAFMLAGYVSPIAQAGGPEGSSFMRHLMGRTRFLTAIAVAAGLTTLTGILLYWPASGNRPSLDWILTGRGLALSIGGVAGVAATIVAGSVQGRAGRRLVSLGDRLQGSGGPSSPEQAAEVDQLQTTLARSGILIAILLVISILGMASAQYLSF